MLYPKWLTDNLARKGWRDGIPGPITTALRTRDLWLRDP